MNVRIFLVHVMKCMCAQTRPRFILSSERVLGGLEFEPMLTPREKSPLAENVPRGGSNPRRCGQRAQALPTELFRPQICNDFVLCFQGQKISYMFVCPVSQSLTFLPSAVLLPFFLFTLSLFHRACPSFKVTRLGESNELFDSFHDGTVRSWWNVVWW